MRLIDANKLIEICRKGWKLFGRENEKLKHWVDEYDIRNQPTIDAIPIDWLRMWFTKKASLIGIVLISEIESDWEKENENV